MDQNRPIQVRRATATIFDTAGVPTEAHLLARTHSNGCIEIFFVTRDKPVEQRLLIRRRGFRQTKHNRPNAGLSAGQGACSENRQLIAESTFVGRPRFGAGDIGAEVRIFLE